MSRPRRLYLSLVGVAFFSTAVSAGQAAKPAVTPPASSTQKPADEGASKKLVAPVRGEALIGYLTPITKREGNMVVTTIKIKNLSSGAIAGLKVDEFWFDKDNQPFTGAQTFRYRKPLQPGEVIDVVLRVPADDRMKRNSYQFEHANGKVKTQLMKKL
jgi:hypothetical protein